MLYVIVFAAALAVSLLLTRANIILAHRYGLLDQPEPRRIHTIPTPRMGGVSMFLAFAATTIVLMLAGYLDAYIGFGILAGSAALTVVGMADDIWGLSPGTKFVFQLAAAVVSVIAFGISIPGVTIPGFERIYLDGSAVGFAITIVWVLGMLNTVNLADGIDGLAGGLTCIFALLLFVIGIRIGQPQIPLYACALGGTALGFLRYNFAPARIFMGDSGSMFLGFVIALLSVLGSAKLLTALLVMGLPVADVAYSIIRRTRSGGRFYMFDKQHLHHRFLTLGLSQRRTDLLFYALALVFGGAALIPGRGSRVTALVLLAALSIVIIWFVNRRLTRNLQSADDGEEGQSPPGGFASETRKPQP